MFPIPLRCAAFRAASTTASLRSLQGCLHHRFVAQPFRAASTTASLRSLQGCLHHRFVAQPFRAAITELG
ncbi:MAG: hypothetical protein A3G21_14825 [Acidobacteria bacterium RIFCSPLOWO2_12_FULL_66_21]|nr:MAG: hypothetical protein A3G21_14825 [Acidobacteria bacterium RIFCSPLOWO2_12_FULL_66_21]